MNAARRNLILAGSLVALILLDLMIAPSHRPQRVVGPLLGNLDVQQAVRIELTGQENQHLVLQREEQGWVLPQSLSYPARSELVRALLSSLASLSTLDLVSSDRDRQGEYGVLAGTHIRILDGEGRVLGELLQGNLAPDGQATFGRLPAEDKTYRMSGLLPLRLDAEYYLDARLLSFEPALVSAILLNTAKGTQRLERDPARVKVWRRGSDGQPVVAARVERLLTSLRATFLAEVLRTGPTQGLNSFHVELEMSQGKPIQFSLGEANEAGLVPAMVGGSAFTVGISQASAQALRAAAQNF